RDEIPAHQHLRAADRARSDRQAARHREERHGLQPSQAGDQRADAKERPACDEASAGDHRQMTTASRLVPIAAVFLLPPAASAQNLAQRVASAPDGPVQFTYAARPGVCGNGRTYYSINGSMWFGSMNDNMLRSDPCQPGPVRVVLGRAGKEVVDVNVYVGPPQTTPGAADLGVVSAKDAADY